MQPHCRSSHHLHSAQSVPREDPRLQGAPVSTYVHSSMPSQDTYAQVVIQRSYMAPEAGSNTAHLLSRMDEDSPMASIKMEGRMITVLDANSSPKWNIIPTVQHLFDKMHSEDQNTFRACKPHHQHQRSLIDLLNWTRDHPKLTPPQEMLNALCHSKPGDNSKKRWFCGMKECKKKSGDTLEHLRSHLQSKTHLDKTFYYCNICLHGFHYQHDLSRHKRNKHKGETAIPKGDAPQGHQPGVQRRPSVNKSKRAGPYQVRPPRRAPSHQDPSRNSTAGFQASDNAPAATQGPSQSAAGQQTHPMRRTRSMAKTHQMTNNGVTNASYPGPSETRPNQSLWPVNHSYHILANSHDHNYPSLDTRFTVPMHVPRTSYPLSTNQATNDLPQPLIGDSSILDPALDWLREFEFPPNSLQPHSNSDPPLHASLTTAAHSERENLPHRSGPNWQIDPMISYPNLIAVVNSTTTPHRLQQNAPPSSTQITSETSNPRLSNNISYAGFPSSSVIPNSATSRSPSSRDPRRMTFQSQETDQPPFGHGFR